MVKLGRLITAMVTPFDAAGAVDYGRAEALAAALVASGSDGLVLAGTTGESPTLSEEEKLGLFRRIKALLGDRAAVIANTGNYNTRESIELTKAAEQTGVDAILLVVPYYNRPPQEGLYQHFRAIATATSLPCILYNVPSRSVASLAPETVLHLREAPNIVGIKEASGNLEQIGRIIRDCGPDFRVWSGNDGDTLPILALGGYGVISVASHLVGRQIKRMIEAYVAGRQEEAARLHLHLLPLFSALFVVANPIPVKHALGAAGFPVGAPRLPLVPPDEASARTIDETLARYEIDLPLQARSRTVSG